MSLRNNITILLILFFFGDINAQQPSIKNLTLPKEPHVQFNDIITYKNDLWFITNTALCKLKNNQIIKVIPIENLSKFVIVDHQFIVYSIYGEFFELKNNKLIPLNFNPILTKKLNNKIINSVEYNDSTFWVSSVVGNGLIKIDLKKETIKNVSAAKDYPYFVFKEKGMLISGNNSSSDKKELAVKFSTPLHIPIAENLNFSKTNIIKLQDETYVFTRQYEVIHFSSKKILNRAFVEKNIEDILQDKTGKIWLALNGGGVISFPDAKFSSSNAVKYFGNKTIISIAEDNNGTVWFGSSGDGVYKLTYPKPIKYDAPKMFSIVNQNSENIKGNLITSTIPKISEKSSKVISVNANQNLLPPAVFINEIKINGINSELLNYYELHHNENNLQINISGVQDDGSELQYKYILEGIDTNWNYSTSTSFYYASLKPGNYTFKAYAMSDKGIWSKTPVVVTFNITPPFYQSIWFILTCVLVVVSIVLLMRYFAYRRKEKQSKRLEEEKRKALVAELHALRSQMNPHFIFNTLSSIQSYITKNNSNDAIYYLSKFSKLMRSTLENTQQQKISLKDEIEMLSLYMDLEKLRLNQKFDYEINVDEKIDVQFDEIPPLLVQPFIENAIWHGISHKKEIGFVKVNFELIDENTLKCTVVDNGIGRKRAKEITAHQNKNKSLGLSITKERLEIINSLKNSKLNVAIADLENEGIPSGTKIELFIPLD